MKTFCTSPFSVIAIMTALLSTIVWPPWIAAAAPLPDGKTGDYLADIDFAGGSRDGMELYQIRWGSHGSFERVVLEFTGGAVDLPRMEIRTEKYPIRMVIGLPGAPHRSSSLFTSPDPFAKSRLLAGVSLFDLCQDNQSLALIPARPVEFDVFGLNNPPRIVIDLRLSQSLPPEQEKYSLRTLPLLGDQPCTFLEAARASGFTPRLLTDGSGNIFGEVDLYSNLREAFSARDGLKKLSEHFSLLVKTRGVMETPATVP